MAIDFRLSIKKRKSKLNKLNLDSFSNDHVDYIKMLTNDSLSERANGVSFDYNQLLDEYEDIGVCLRNNGIVIIKNFIKNVDALNVNKIRLFLKSCVDSKLEGKSIDNDNFLVQFSGETVKGYQNLQSHSKSVVDIRRSEDRGMIDLFNADRIFGEELNELKSALNSNSITRVLSNAYKERLKAKNLNLYFNESITKTRGFHIDAYERQLKAFVYLSDVSSLDYGPYTYVLGTNNDSQYRLINSELSRFSKSATDSPIVPLSDILPVLGSAGTLVISDQSGIHRGFPQKSGFERLVAVMKFS